MALEYADLLLGDLDMFSKHAKRNTIKVEDLKLAGRKSEALVQRLDAFERDTLEPEREKRKETTAQKKQKKMMQHKDDMEVNGE